ncbi:MAG TPA: hypothetical protein VK711_01520, partial [Puia sp.]|nr:hypothetical protein [Puia sp.]
FHLREPADIGPFGKTGRNRFNRYGVIVGRNRGDIAVILFTAHDNENGSDVKKSDLTSYLHD